MQQDYEPWTIKYKPQKISDIKGQDTAIKEISAFLKDYKKQKKKAIFLHGPTGTGKTAIAIAYAKERDYEILEVNASDFRNQERINAIVGQNSKQQSLFFRPKLILVDEIDGLTGQQDRGGAIELARLIETTTFPMILTANDPWEKKLSPVRKESKLVEFNPVSHEDTVKILDDISKKEKISYEEDALKAISRKNAGDIRGAITDLQSLSQVHRKITKEAVAEISDRKKTETINSALLKIFKTTDAKLASEAFENIDQDLDECLLWIDENLPKEYEKPNDLVRAYEHLSRAAVFNGRIRRWQHWRFLVYYSALMTAGVAVSKDEKYKKQTDYTQTKRLLKIWMAKQSNAKRDSIAEKIAVKTHNSVKQTIKETIPYVKHIFRKNKEMSCKITAEFELEKEEIDWLKK